VIPSTSKAGLFLPLSLSMAAAAGRLLLFSKRALCRMKDLNPHRRTLSTVSTHAKSQFEEDGVVCIRNAIPEEFVESLRQACEKNMKNPGPLCDEHSAAAGSAGRFHDDQFLWRRHDECRAYLFNSPVAKIAAQIMGSTSVNILYDHLLVKEPGTVAPTPWHNDYSYWQIRGNDICSIWLALDKVKRENMVTYVRGSHRWKMLHKITNFSGEDSDDGRYAQSPNQEEIPLEAIHRGEYELLGWDMEPGDIVVHHGWTLHGATGNTDLKTMRRGYATRWLGDDITFDPRPGTMHFKWAENGYDCGLQPGAKMECELFPIVYSSSSA